MKLTMLILAAVAAGAAVASAQAPVSGNPVMLAASKGVYRLPYDNGTRVKVFDDFETHRPVGRIDFFAVRGTAPYRVVAAAAGRVAAIQDGFAERQSDRASQWRMDELFASRVRIGDGGSASSGGVHGEGRTVSGV
jgi:hypothetical protein